MKKLTILSILFLVCMASVFMFVACGEKAANEQSNQETFTVVWKNYDGSVLETDTGVIKNAVPSYDGAAPIKPEDDNYTYTWNGWTPNVTATTKNATYTAAFNATPKKEYDAELLSLEGFNDEGDKYYTLTVPNAVTSYDFSDLITVSEEATYTVRRDVETNPSADEIVNLMEGRNRILINVYSKDGKKHNYFTVDIYRNRMFTVYLSLYYKKYDYDNSEQWENANADLGDNTSITVEEGNLVPVPEFKKRLGFDFDYGDYDFETPATPGQVNTYMAITGTVKDEMRIFDFESTADTCEIKNIWVKNEQEFTELTVPEYVTAFSARLDHANLKKIYWNAAHCINAKADDSSGIFYGNSYVDCELIIGDKVEYIDKWTFDGKDTLKKITIGSGLKEVGESAFGNIYRYGPMTVYDFYIKDLKQWIEIEGLDKAIFEYSSFNLYLNNELITELTIPDGITEIPAKIFKYGSYRKITIPEGVTKIGDETFRGCNQVQVLSLPDTLTEIGESAFLGVRITELVIPDNVVSIGNYAFSSSTLTRVVLGTGLKDGTVAENAFDGCNIFEIYDKCYFAFDYDNTACGKVAVNAYRIIKPNDYNQESSLHKVQGADGNTYVYYERYNQSELKNERILRGYIGNNTDLIIPDSITQIIDSFAAGDIYITSVSFDGTDSTNWNGGVLDIGADAFNYCPNLKVVSFGDGKYNIKGFAGRSYDRYLEEVHFGEGEYSSFRLNRCKVSKVYVNDMANWGGIECYDGNGGLTYDIYVGASNEVLKNLIIADGVETTKCYSYSNIESVVIPESVNKISEGSFNNCKNLVSIFYKGDKNGFTAITLQSYNTEFISATVYYYSETEPAEEGNFWHYVNGEPTSWGV